MASQDETQDDETQDDETLTEAFWGVARRLHHLSRETLGPWEITPSHGRALAVLGRHGMMRLSELSEHLHIAARSTTEVVDALEERSLIERRPDPQDRRATLVTLTEEGARINAAIQAARRDEAESFFGTLSETDRANLARILRKLHG
jgi:DNA-binding MarR family transcriptional regulator